MRQARADDRIKPARFNLFENQVTLGTVIQRHIQIKLFRNPNGSQNIVCTVSTVSYTHLDVYKRQQQEHSCVSENTLTEGICSLQIFMAFSQRSTNGQPFGGSNRSGGEPGIGFNSLLSSSGL